MKLTQEALKDLFKEAAHLEVKYVGVRIKMKGYPADEIIINPSPNFKAKQSYYEKVYDSFLGHRHADGVDIVAYTYGNSFADIEKALIGE